MDFRKQPERTSHYNLFVEVIGEDATQKLCVELGGDAFYVPCGRDGHKSANYQALVKAIGIDSAAIFCDNFGNEAVYIPKGKLLTTTNRNQQIISEWNGENLQFLAKKYGLTKRSIQRIVQNVVVTPNGNVKKG